MLQIIREIKLNLKFKVYDHSLFVFFFLKISPGSTILIFLSIFVWEFIKDLSFSDKEIHSNSAVKTTMKIHLCVSEKNLSQNYKPDATIQNTPLLNNFINISKCIFPFLFFESAF